MLNLLEQEVNIALKVLPFLFIGGAYSTANLLSCQLQDGGAFTSVHRSYMSINTL